MLRGALFATAAAMLIALSAWTLHGGPAGVEAAKPQLIIGGASVSGQENCIVIVNWSGLPGGKPLYVTTWLEDGTGTRIWNTLRATKVRQGDGQLVVDYEGVGGVAGVGVSFADNRQNPLGAIDGTGTCN